MVESINPGSCAAIRSMIDASSYKVSKGITSNQSTMRNRYNRCMQPVGDAGARAGSALFRYGLIGLGLFVAVPVGVAAGTVVAGGLAVAICTTGAVKLTRKAAVGLSEISDKGFEKSLTLSKRIYKKAKTVIFRKTQIESEPSAQNTGPRELSNVTVLVDQFHQVPITTQYDRKASINSVESERLIKTPKSLNHSFPGAPSGTAVRDVISTTQDDRKASINSVESERLTKIPRFPGDDS